MTYRAYCHHLFNGDNIVTTVPEHFLPCKQKLHSHSHCPEQENSANNGTSYINRLLQAQSWINAYQYHAVP
jgi:hypothetical protein